MNKAKELKTVAGLVREILAEDKQARNSDSFLYFKILKKIGEERGIDIDSMSVTRFLLNMKDYQFPCFETVRRARAKLQAEYPEYSGDRTVKAYREENEKAFREFARSGV